MIDDTSLVIELFNLVIFATVAFFFSNPYETKPF